MWVADFAYIRITTGFCFLAAILDACRRKAVGYAISRRIDTQLALAALNAAVQLGSRRQTPERSRRRPQAGMALGVLAEHWKLNLFVGACRDGVWIQAGTFAIAGNSMAAPRGTQRCHLR